MKEIKYETIRFDKDEMVNSSPGYRSCKEAYKEMMEDEEIVWITRPKPGVCTLIFEKSEELNPNAPIIYEAYIYWYTKWEIINIFFQVFLIFLIILISFYFVLKKKWKK